MTLYILGAAVLGMAQLAPAVLELGVWGVGQVMYGTYWIVWGRREPQRQEERMRFMVREELRHQLTQMQFVHDERVMLDENQNYRDVPLE